MTRLLKRLTTPAELQTMSLTELEELAGEIRELILTTVAKNGGHLAPSLGTVELTLALYSVFDFSRDRLIWDVGHQAYTHKILTGRRDTFHTLRTLGGITGFPKRAESP
ncbi:MAG: 1-deoxy-D-xylulose-5-phosphate synthase, partial [Selenomonadaceae bacterium]|nr:1-deoxy-D-xylulose-5-phosphate synthase [Selenomonadaceae bacterium]